MEDNEYKLVVGLEIHIEPKTNTKMFCSCKNDSEETAPNTNVCPVCMGHPGMLPVCNKLAIQKIIKLGLALGCQISPIARFDRKNYFYPDLPKGYQITQGFAPFCLKGELPLFLSSDDVIKKISLHDIHLEEDAGKLLHTNEKNFDMVDFNRAGVPLIELVSEPVIYSAEDARVFGESLQLLMKYLGISNADMEKGEMRVEVNVSLGKEIDGKIQLGQKVEVKNINSFSAAFKAIEYERTRQLELLQAGEKIVGETRG
jgi:aspartyl-tRNA(Asn)/glutamyl-tRNA(Gln) amidotransferase subunit B